LHCSSWASPGTSLLVSKYLSSTTSMLECSQSAPKGKSFRGQSQINSEMYCLVSKLASLTCVNPNRPEKFAQLGCYSGLEYVQYTHDSLSILSNRSIRLKTRIKELTCLEKKHIYSLDVLGMPRPSFTCFNLQSPI
jgi:hypothetical protein